jgi:hypothetical protein
MATFGQRPNSEIKAAPFHTHTSTLTPQLNFGKQRKKRRMGELSFLRRSFVLKQKNQKFKAV